MQSPIVSGLMNLVVTTKQGASNSSALGSP